MYLSYIYICEIYILLFLKFKITFYYKDSNNVYFYLKKEPQ